ncbi:hypothetical protein J25TS5_04530 [Paenibacillus faecis]|uniref:hypothetical protein n=1 Tax=Paenibacillus faecis TaxID=862114 RepID=UPI001B15426A|nr:hypothetical protein [Paenibacillus faecis]GIO83521.1 hypothetical protein J25TS5_04530 [Paenibacillus faecis]
MKPNEEEVLRETFQNLLERKVTPELLQDFIERSRLYHKLYNEGNPDILAVLDELETKIPKGA